METGLLVNKCFTKASLIVFIAIALNSIAAAEDSQASDRQEIRFYKIHKGGATQRIRFTAKKAKRPGCHNFLRRARLHRAVQFAYKTCRVYSKKNCSEDSLVFFDREKDSEPTSDLTQGYGWYPVGEHERGEIVRSWYCESLQAD